MATTKTRDRKAAKPPLSIDEIVLRDNVAAAKKAPAETVAQLSTRYLYLSGKEDLSAELQKALRDMKKGKGGLRLALPSSTAFG
jgi:7-keto-8-aminopelargonate synthetase-like enzyme